MSKPWNPPALAVGSTFNSEMAEIVTSHLDQRDDIIRYIKERKVITRDLDMSHLTEYLADIHRSVGEGFL